jgi:hypothetical protein
MELNNLMALLLEEFANFFAAPKVLHRNASLITTSTCCLKCHWSPSRPYWVPAAPKR